MTYGQGAKRRMLIADSDRSLLESLFQIYRDMEGSLERKSYTNAARERLIESGNRLVKELSSSVLKPLLENASLRASRLGAQKPAGDALRRATTQASLGIPGIVPTDHGPFKAHVKGMIGALAEMLGHW